jgi:hypothetical protein
VSAGPRRGALLLMSIGVLLVIGGVLALMWALAG